MKLKILLLLGIIFLLIGSLFIKKNTMEGFTDGYTEACRELTGKRNFLQSYVGYLRAPIQDLNATMISAKLAKQENMAFQNVWNEKCSSIQDIETNTSTTAKACRALASVDQYELGLLDDIDQFYASVLLENQDKLDYNLRYLNFYTNLMKCPMPSSSKVTFDASENLLAPDASGNIVNPKTHISISRDIGDLDTTTLLLELEKLSPYYLSPDVVQYIISFMISQQNLDYLRTTSQDYVNGIHNLMDKVGTFYMA